MRYLVSYDLKRHKNYARLYAELDNLRAIKIHASLWGIYSSLSIDQITMSIKSATDWDDEILIFPAPPGYQIREKNLRYPAKSFLDAQVALGIAGFF
ncbi:hypothetical protein HBA92_22075 [Ochrobactrum sp. MR28]|nr:hypothetical protein [Ochrobactrum sp. MR28]MBX8819011.1 hypothetical protein [Ochrobactrum sp. MR31]